MQRRSFLAGAPAVAALPTAAAPIVEMHENDVRPVGVTPFYRPPIANTCVIPDGSIPDNYLTFHANGLVSFNGANISFNETNDRMKFGAGPIDLKTGGDRSS